MAYQIIWTAEADDDFRSIVFYLKENWSVNSAEKFAIRTMKRLERIAEMRYEPKVYFKARCANDKIGQEERPFLFNRWQQYGAAEYLSLQKRY